ncbi:hypothetical protein CLAIMM_06458 [Cladophialophora immunda]|nr:hypothetical protein CLAIMM_06458 [Cladophialophora immunda]
MVSQVADQVPQSLACQPRCHSSLDSARRPMFRRKIQSRLKMLFDEKQVFAAFDDLVARQIILHGPETVVRTRDQGFDFEFRICPALASKPATADATNNAAFEQLPKYGPGSDLVDADPGVVVTKIHGTHLLVLNLFAVFRPQYLILTLDSFRRQTENLDKTDLSAAWRVLHHLSHEHFVMFNCGSEAGCSRLHKHMQVIPCSEGLTLFPDLETRDPRAFPSDILFNVSSLKQRARWTLCFQCTRGYGTKPLRSGKPAQATLRVTSLTT